MTATSTDSTASADLAGPFDVTPQDVELFDRLLRPFVPPNAFDAHAHMWDVESLDDESAAQLRKAADRAGWQTYREHVGRWMGDRTPAAGLFFAHPIRSGQYESANQHIADELKENSNLRGLIFVTPDDDPDKIDQQIAAGGFCGIKVYCWHATGPEPYQAEIGEFLPEWAWQIADKRGLAIMLHMVRDRALADPLNQQYILDHCGRYRSAKLILAHCARCFNVAHALEGIAPLRDLDNVYFDNSAITEPGPAEQIIKTFGPTRLMFGMDFPISQLRGTSTSIGDGFLWVDESNVDWAAAPYGRPTVFGFENIYALQQACRNTHLTDADIEHIFFGTAHRLFNVGTPPSGTGQALYHDAKKIIPVGTQLLSKLPEWWAPEQWPAYYREGRGCITVDMDGRHLIDVSSMGIGACVLGFADPDVTAAVIRRVQFGSMTTLMVPEEVELARLLLEIHPWAEKVRFARTGGGSMAAAVRFARATTGREKVAICGYHGWHDWYLAANIGDHHALDDHLLPNLAPNGLPARLVGSALVFGFNDLAKLEQLFAQNKGEIAAVTLEPLRFVMPDPGFLEGAKRLCEANGAKLIFDEITIGWKYAFGGSHLRLGTHPHIAVFAKTVSNGHPMGVIIGTEEAMRGAEASFVSSAYWTEAVGPTAALAAIQKMRDVDVAGHVDKVGARFKQIWHQAADKHSLSLKTFGCNCFCGFTLDVPDVAAAATLLTADMLRRGFLAKQDVMPSYAHKPHHLEAYAEALDATFANIADGVRQGDLEKRIGGPVKLSGFVRKIQTDGE